MSVPLEIDPNRCPPRQRDLIEAIETEADRKDNGPSTLPLTLLRKGIEELKSEILTQVRGARMARELSSPRSNKGQFKGNSPLLCVLFHPVDEHGLGREVFEILKGEAFDVG